MTGRADYQDRREARVARHEALAEKKAAKAEQLHQANHQILSIMNGTPILVGHHSEKRHRRDLARIDQRLGDAVRLEREAEQHKRRAKRAEESRAISSDDPDALDKLRARVARLKEQRELGKRINKAFRKGGADAVEPLAPKVAATLRSNPLFGNQLPIPGFSTKNLSAEIRRLEGRITELERREARGDAAPGHFGELRIEERDNRVQLYFPGKPRAEVRQALKRAGFRWAPSVGAWQRHANDLAWRDARQLAERFAVRWG